MVAMPSEPESILFYKSKVSEKWWMEVPVSDSGSPFSRNRIIPCSYSDYETANKGEVPERYINTIGKMS